jgi:hypothetical protein
MISVAATRFNQPQGAASLNPTAILPSNYTKWERKMHFHAVYLQKRQAGVSYRDFQRLWRSHGDFAASIPEFWTHVHRYIHNDPVEDSRGIPGDTSNYDAVGELYYPDYATWMSLRDVMWEQVAPDEKRVFPGPSTAVRGDRVVFAEPEGRFKLFTFAKFASNIEQSDFERVLENHADLTLNTRNFGSRLQGYTVTRARRHDPASNMDARPQTASNMDLVFIHHFANEAAARSALLSADYARVQVSEDKIVDFDSRISVLTHAWILKDG